MGNLRACFAVALLALAACGSDGAKVDAGIKLIDAAMPDSKVWNDAPPGPDYDLTCLNAAPPTTGADPITIAGTTQSFSMSGAEVVGGAAVDLFKKTSSTAIATTTSDMTTGAFTSGNLVTGGTPLDGYIRAGKATFRTTYMYPPTVVPASLTDVPVLMIPNSLFSQIEIATGAQDDTMNGAMLIAVTDCNLADQTLVGEAVVKVQQGGADVGAMFGLGAFDPSLAGTFIVGNVPDGETQILVTYEGTAWPTRTVRAFKAPMGQDAEGTLTFTAIRPGG
jgi:hypothetical protein